LDCKEILVGTGEIADRDDLSLQIGEFVHARISAGQNAQAATRVPEAILTSNPCSSGFSQRNTMPIPASVLARSDGLQKLIGRPVVINQLDIKILLLKEAIVNRHRNRHIANRIDSPRKFQFPRRPREHGFGRRFASRGLRPVLGHLGYAG
jgi:hypothetical protein